MTGLECYLCKHCVRAGPTGYRCELMDEFPLNGLPYMPKALIFNSRLMGRHCDYHEFCFEGHNAIFRRKETKSSPPSPHQG